MSLSSGVRVAVVARDGYACRYCGTVCFGSLIPESNGPLCTVDHVRPYSHGGPGHMSNLAVACQACNKRKGNATLESLGWTLRPPRAAEEKVARSLRFKATKFGYSEQRIRALMAEAGVEAVDAELMAVPGARQELLSAVRMGLPLRTLTRAAERGRTITAQSPTGDASYRVCAGGGGF